YLAPRANGGAHEVSVHAEGDDFSRSSIMAKSSPSACTLTSCAPPLARGARYWRAMQEQTSASPPGCSSAAGRLWMARRNSPSSTPPRLALCSKLQQRLGLN